MSKLRFGILMVIAIFAMVSVVSAGLPSSINAYVIGVPGGNSYWSLHVNSVTPASENDVLVPGTTYNDVWCGDISATLNPGVSYDFVVTPTNSYPPPITVPGVLWQNVNYVLNHRLATTGPGSMDMYTVQRIFWEYDGGAYSWGSPNMIQVSQKKAEATTFISSNPKWYPQYCGEHYAVALKSTGHQQIFIDLPVPNCINPPPAPEFPTIALPLGMLVGLVGLVFVMKGRED